VVDLLAPQVARFLSMPPSSGIRVHVSEKMYLHLSSASDAVDQGTYGAVVSGAQPSIVLGGVSLSSQDMLNYSLAHELTHWHMRGTRWVDTPYLMQEAMADFIGTMFWPGAREERTKQIEQQGIGADRSVLALTMEDLDRMPREQRQRACLSALVIASQIGFDRLPLLVAEGRPLFGDG